MKTKRCSKCKETKPVSEFCKNKSQKDGIDHCCKSCKSERARRYREANKEKIAEKNRRYYEANKEKIHERNRRWREANREQECRRSVKRQREINKRSLELAHRQGQPWEDWEDEFVMTDNGLTNYQKAVRLGRSNDSVYGRCEKLRKSARAELAHND